MNVFPLIEEILKELQTLRAENAQLRHDVSDLSTKLALIEHKVDSVADEMGLI